MTEINRAAAVLRKHAEAMESKGKGPSHELGIEEVDEESISLRRQRLHRGAVVLNALSSLLEMEQPEPEDVVILVPFVGYIDSAAAEELGAVMAVGAPTTRTHGVWLELPKDEPRSVWR